MNAGSARVVRRVILSSNQIPSLHSQIAFITNHGGREGPASADVTISALFRPGAWGKKPLGDRLPEQRTGWTCDMGTGWLRPVRSKGLQSRHRHRWCVYKSCKVRGFMRTWTQTETPISPQHASLNRTLNPHPKSHDPLRPEQPSTLPTFDLKRKRLADQVIFDPATACQCSLGNAFFLGLSGVCCIALKGGVSTHESDSLECA